MFLSTNASLTLKIDTFSTKKALKSKRKWLPSWSKSHILCKHWSLTSLALILSCSFLWIFLKDQFLCSVMNRHRSSTFLSLHTTLSPSKENSTSQKKENTPSTQPMPARDAQSSRNLHISTLFKSPPKKPSTLLSPLTTSSAQEAKKTFLNSSGLETSLTAMSLTLASFFGNSKTKLFMKRLLRFWKKDSSIILLSGASHFTTSSSTLSRNMWKTTQLSLTITLLAFRSSNTTLITQEEPTSLLTKTSPPSESSSSVKTMRNSSSTASSTTAPRNLTSFWHIFTTSFFRIASLRQGICIRPSQLMIGSASRSSMITSIAS